ncbi:MAG: HAD family hydrolase [Candidatus Levybacteria bacterium]|nr:HAD family hydrolase [Candidatus Levybacteria bacterium]
MIKLIIFDWDDVFTKGSTEGYFRSYHQALVSVGVNLSPEEEKKRILAKWGSPVEEELGELLQEHPQLLDEAVVNYERILFSNTFVDCLSLVEGARSLLKRLSENYTLTVATGINPRLLKEKIMPKFDIPPVFSQIVSVYDVPDKDKGKPHPFMVEQILTAQHVLPEEAVLVGDARNDVLMARAAGVTPIVVLTGHLNETEAREMGIPHIIPDVTHLERVLSHLQRLEGQTINGKERL